MSQKRNQREKLFSTLSKKLDALQENIDKGVAFMEERYSDRELFDFSGIRQASVWKRAKPEQKSLFLFVLSKLSKERRNKALLRGQELICSATPLKSFKGNEELFNSAVEKTQILPEIIDDVRAVLVDGKEVYKVASAGASRQRLSHACQSVCRAGQNEYTQERFDFFFHGMDALKKVIHDHNGEIQPIMVATFFTSRNFEKTRDFLKQTGNPPPFLTAMLFAAIADLDKTILYKEIVEPISKISAEIYRFGLNHALNGKAALAMVTASAKDKIDVNAFSRLLSNKDQKGQIVNLSLLCEISHHLPEAYRINAKTLRETVIARHNQFYPETPLSKPRGLKILDIIDVLDKGERFTNAIPTVHPECERGFNRTLKNWLAKRTEPVYWLTQDFEA